MEIARPGSALCPICAVRSSSYVVIGYAGLPKVGLEVPPPSHLQVAGCEACFWEQREVPIMVGERRVTLRLPAPEDFNPCACIRCGTRESMVGVLMAWHYLRGECTMQRTLTSVCSRCATLGVPQAL